MTLKHTTTAVSVAFSLTLAPLAADATEVDLRFAAVNQDGLIFDNVSSHGIAQEDVQLVESFNSEFDVNEFYYCIDPPERVNGAQVTPMEFEHSSGAGRIAHINVLPDNPDGCQVFVEIIGPSGFGGLGGFYILLY